MLGGRSGKAMSEFVLSFGPPRKPVESEVLHESRSSFVVRHGEAVHMDANAKWGKALADVARRFHIERLLVSAACAKGGLAFLDELPGLKELSVSVPDQTLDWRPVERLKRLEALSVSSAPMVRTQPPGGIDFTGLPALVSCALSDYDAQWSSVFSCGRLRRLQLTTTNALRGELDLSGLPELTELVLGGLPKVTSFKLAAAAKVRSLQLRSCRKLQVDWPPTGQDLRYLWIEGKTAWPLADLRDAPKLERLMLSHRGRIESAAFLRDLPRLKWLELFLAEFTPEGKALVNSLPNLQASGLTTGEAASRRAASAKL
jgi:hypothetical protein